MIIPDNGKLLKILFGLLSLLVAVTILQDYLDSRRNNYAFHFSESLLFKTNWLLFIPLLFFQVNLLLKKGRNNLHRILQAFIPLLLHLLILPFLLWGFSSLFFSSAYSYEKVFTYTLSNDLYKLIFIYGGVTVFYHRRSVSAAAPENVSDDKERTLQKILVANGRNYVAVDVKEILYLKAATPYISIHTEGKQYLHTETLKSMLENLDRKRFVRVHRSAIVNQEMVVSYRSRLNGDYDLVLKNGNEIRLSRNYVADFKKSFRTEPQVKQ